MKKVCCWRHTLLGSVLAAGLAGCGSLDTLQSHLIFQHTTEQRALGTADLQSMQDIWLHFTSTASGEAVRLHALWHPARTTETAPVVLYLHGARWDVVSSAMRIEQLQTQGFSVLAVDYRGFGKSDPVLPNESRAYEDAAAAWQWLAERYPAHRRFIYGHSLGGAIAIELASQVNDESGTIVEGSFTSIPEVFAGLRFGWLPLQPLITQRFAAVDRVAHINSPLLVIHGSNDRVVRAELGRRLYDAAREPKRFVLIDGGSHRNTLNKGKEIARQAMRELFDLQHISPLATASATAD